jgi:hypothetical protein
LQTVKLYIIDLTSIRGRGEFKCPRCGIKISPDDKTEDAYTILELVMKGDCLDKIILQCNKCGSQIHLTGFHILSKLR